MRTMLLATLLFAATPAFADIAPPPAPTASATLGDRCDDVTQCVTGLRCKDGTCAEPLIAYTTYKTVHLAAVLTLLFALGGLIFLSFAKSEDKLARRIATILHGVAMLLLLAGGFGLMARLGVKHGEGWPTWIKIKMGLWILLGAYVVVPKRLPSWNRKLWPLALVVAAFAAASAIHKFGA
jgi:uncharacterized membrane protein SirB2